MKKNETRFSMRKYVAAAIIFTVIVIVIANGGHLFMQWLIDEIDIISDSLVVSEFVFLGTLAIVSVILAIGLIIIYRKRRRELIKLSEGLEKIARGDFSARIEYGSRDSMGPVYRNFNKMSLELSSVQLLRNDFINNFSHEFKTPIASINGFASLLLEKEFSREEQKNYLTIIKEESERLSKLTSNTLLLSKLTSSDIVSEKSRYDLGEQIRQCSIILSQEWLEKDQVFSGDIDQVDFVGNYDLMQHLWINIIGNAVKYTPVGGEISVELHRQDGNAIISVTDTGRGMDEETLSHLFDPYYQADSAHSSDGMGLGLSIAKQIVDLCEGSITVRSRLNEGSEFVVSLPTGVY